jgi:hypothetical protein
MEQGNAFLYYFVNMASILAFILPLIMVPYGLYVSIKYKWHYLLLMVPILYIYILFFGSTFKSIVGSGHGSGGGKVELHEYLWTSIAQYIGFIIVMGLVIGTGYIYKYEYGANK